MTNKERCKAWREQHPEYRELRKSLPYYGKKYGKRLTDEAARAHTTIHRAIKKGLLVRPNICEMCNDQVYTEASHTDYTKPLDIRWLCRPCHRRDDAASPKNGMTTKPRGIQ